MVVKKKCPHCGQEQVMWVGKLTRCAVCKNLMYVNPKGEVKG